jgi:Zn-dependent alcohol dehydrogenase
VHYGALKAINDIITFFFFSPYFQCWGKTILVGVARPGSELGLSFHDVLDAGGKNIMGSTFGGIKAKSDIPILLKRYLDKVI